MMMPKPWPSRPANVISPPSIASAAVIGGIRCVSVPFGVPIGQLVIASLASMRGYARSPPRRSAQRSSTTTGARPLIAARGHTRAALWERRIGGRRNFTNFGGLRASEMSSMAVLLVMTAAEQEHRPEDAGTDQDRHARPREQALA